MKLWIGGEVCAEVADSFRYARIIVEKAVNEAISEKNYAVNFNSWDCIAILRDDKAFKEITKYSLKKKEMDFRLQIDFDKFRSVSDVRREALIFEMLLRSLALLKEKKGIGEEIDRLAADVKIVAIEHGWLTLSPD